MNFMPQWLVNWLYSLIEKRIPDIQQRLHELEQNRSLAVAQRALAQAYARIDEQNHAIKILAEGDAQQVLQQFRFLAGEIIAKNDEISTLQAEIAHLKEAADIDPLTGLANRRGIKSQFMREFAPLARSQVHPPHDVSERRDLPVISLIAHDIDHFKRINDQHGHQAGDQVLSAFARLMRSEMGHRIGDIHGRAGGEEFFVIMPTASTERAYAQAEAFRQLIEQATFTVTNLRGEKVDLKLTVSCGISTIEVTEERKLPSVAFDQLYTLADQALYAAKHGGRNRVIRFNQLPLEE